MQASQIKLGQTYAATMSNKEVALTVTEMVTVKERTKTTNYVNGRIPGTVETPYFWVEKVPVADLIDEISKHQALLDVQKQLDEERKANEQARAEKQWLTVQLLAKAIGAQAIRERHKPYGWKKGDVGHWVEWDEKAPAVIIDYSEIKINPPAFDKIIETFGSFADNQIGA